MKRFMIGFVSVVFFMVSVFSVGGTLFAQGPPHDATNKIAYIIQQRIKAVEARFGATSRGRLTSKEASALSDNLVKVSTSGELRLAFHAARAIGEKEKEDLRALGARIITSSDQIKVPKGVKPLQNFGLIEVWITYGKVLSAAALDWVVAVTPVEENPPDTGTFESEGVTLHRADIAQSAGLDGTGITIGAISDGVTNLADAQASGDLPASVNVLNAGSGDEGTAMLEIIHDMAPGAALAFHGTGGGVAGHVTALNALVIAGVDIITEDIPFDAEPAFQQGAVAATAESIAAPGIISVHSSAGNRGDNHAARVQAVGTGQRPDGDTNPFAGCTIDPANVVAIAPGNDTTFDVVIGANGASFTLQWSEPRAIFPTAGAGGFTNLDLYIMDSGRTQCLYESLGVQGGGSGDTIEQIVVPSSLAGTAVKVVVNVRGATGAVAPPILDLRWRGTQQEIDLPTREGSLNPDSNYTALGTSVGAVNAGPFGGSTDPLLAPLEGFSSGGPVQLVLTTVCPGAYPCPAGGVAGPAAVIAGAPNWTAADGVSVSGAGGFGSPVPGGGCPGTSDGDCLFFGTSASAPHAAACDALVRQSFTNQSLTFTNSDIYLELTALAIDRGLVGFDNEWGAGILRCVRLADLSVTKTDNPDPVTLGSNLTYTVTVTNSGLDEATEVTVTDTLPSSVTYMSATPSQGSCLEGGGIVTCNLGNLSNGSQASITIVVTPMLAGLITNTVEVTANEPDPTPENNAFSENTLVNTPPVALCQDVTVPTEPGVCYATASIDDGSYDPDGDPITLVQTPPPPYPLGETLVTLTVTDDKGASDSCTATVTVLDQEPPVIESLKVSPSLLWPPNHKMVPVKVTASATDNCTAAPVCKIISVSSNEPENGLGDGDTFPDWKITGNLTLKLRAERSGKGSGRIYTVTIGCSDDSGNSAEGEVTVTVPHDRGKKKKK